MVRLGEQPQRVRVRRRVRRKRKRNRRRAALIAAGVLVFIAILTLVPALLSRARLVEARDAVVAGREALREGDPAAARAAFERAQSAFVRAKGYVENPMLRLVGYLPILGRTPDATIHLAQAGARVATAGRVIAEALQGIPGGMGAFAPSGGAIPLEPVEALSPALEDADHLLDQARGFVARSPDRWLLGPVAEARRVLDAELEDTGRTVEAGVALTRTLPSFLGADGPRRYFFGAQNPAEIRGTGGFIGAYAILTADEGSLEFSPFRPIQSLPNLPPQDVQPPNADFALRYDRYGSRGFWPNVNMSPDFPSSATAMETLYREGTGQHLDGTIVADPFALASLLRVAGPVQVPGTEVIIRPRTAVPYLTNQAYAEITDSDARKRLLGDAAEEVFERFLSGEVAVDPATAGQTLARTVADGHVLLHADDPQVQAAFQAAGVAGRFPAEGDFLSVSANNAAGNKIDYYLDRRIEYEVRLGAEGSAAATATVHLTNDAPATGPPAYVIGPFSPEYEAGQNVTILATSCARTCRLETFRVDRRPLTVGTERELGHPAHWTVVHLLSGQSQTLEYGWRSGGVWTGDAGAGEYRLTFDGQTTIRPTALRVDIRTPEGTRITGTEPAMQVTGNRALWEGTPGDRMTFEVAFDRPLLARMWRAFVQWLDRPVIRLG